MNFLSHYYIENTSDPYQSLGVILPDIYPRFSKSYNRILRDKHPNSFDLPEHQALHHGILSHYIGDKIFHASSKFSEDVNAITEQLRKDIPSDELRHSFLAHVLYELMIDRILVKHDRKLADKLYDSLSTVSEEAVDNYLKMNEIEKNKAVFFGNFKRFLEYKYVFQYANNDRLVYALNRVYSRTKAKPLSSEQLETLENRMDQVEESLHDKAFAILSETSLAKNEA